MQEIAEGIYIERNYPGVVLGALRIGSTVVMVDAPLRAQDQQSWRIDVANLGGGADKLLVMLDTHIDRTLGIRAMERRVVGHQRALEILNNRPTTARGQDFDAGADWEPYELPANIRWPVLDLTYSDKMTVYLDDDPVEISHQPGAHVAGSWLRYDSKKVLFVGDSVIIHHPPFFAWSDLDRWLSELDWLTTAFYEDYQIVSGREGVINPAELNRMISFLEKVKAVVAELASGTWSVEAIVDQVPSLLKAFEYQPGVAEMYHNRLVWGIEQYLNRHYPGRKTVEKGEE